MTFADTMRSASPNGLEPRVRIQIIRAAAGLMLVAIIAMNLDLWASRALPEAFPAMPLVRALPELPSSLSWLLIALIVVSTVACFVPRIEKRAAAALLAFYGVACLFDQLRFQPHIFFGVVVLGVVAMRGDHERHTISALRILVGCVYLWAGISKANILYLERIHPWFTSPVADTLPYALAYPIVDIALSGPLMELSLGLLVILYPSRLQRYLWIGPILLHCFVLFCLISLGEDQTVWPWNMAMMTIGVITTSTPGDAASIGTELRYRATRLVLIFGMLLPALGQLGLWDHYHSFSLYSGANPRGVFIVSRAASERLPEPMRGFLREFRSPADEVAPADGALQLSLGHWAVETTGQAIPPENRLFDSLRSQLCQHFAEEPDDIQLRLYGDAVLWSGARHYQVYNCEQSPGLWLRLGSFAHLFLGEERDVLRTTHWR